LSRSKKGGERRKRVHAVKEGNTKAQRDQQREDRWKEGEKRWFIIFE